MLFYRSVSLVPENKERDMTENPNDIVGAQEEIPQADFERISQLVTSEFQVEEALLDHGVPTYYLRWPQETKQAFLRLLQKFNQLNLIAFLRRTQGRVVLTVATKPPVKPSNPLIYWGLFFATVATTFITGYFSFEESGLNPLLSGAIFSAAILTVLGLHEMGHKITANRKKVEATSPYFIPGWPPLGTLGAVIVQKSLPPNRDALFDIGANGPLAGFIVALAFSLVGLATLVPANVPAEGGLSMLPLSWTYLLLPGLNTLGLIPSLAGTGYNGYALGPIAWAGWAGMVVTMLNMLPAAMLDGGHVAKSLVPDKLRFILTIASVAVLLLSGTEFLVFAFLVVFMSMFRHPGPLDDVSGVSLGRKLLTIGLVAVFVLSFPIGV
jgi:membrane-associated protease RseP (regulator of RpoE activity)